MPMLIVLLAEAAVFEMKPVKTEYQQAIWALMYVYLVQLRIADVALATVGFAVFALLEIWRESREMALLVPAGLLAGFAFAIKYTGVVAVLYAAAVVAYVLWRSWKQMLRPVLTVGFCAAILVLPTLVKNWIVVSNPFSPFFNRLFPNPYVHVLFEQEYSRSLRSYGIHSFWLLVYKITTDGVGLSGILGPVFLLAPLSLLALFSAPGRRLLLAGVFFLLPYPMNLSTRFLLPAAVFIAPAMMIGLGSGRTRFLVLGVRGFVALPARFRWRVKKIPIRITLGSGLIIAMLIAVHAYLSWPSHLNRYTSASWHIFKFPWRAALRLQSEDQYLLSYMGPDFQMMRFIERATPPGSKVYCFTAPPSAYCSRELLSWYYSAFNLRLRDVFWAGFDSGAQPLRTLTFRFATQSLRGLRLLETGAAPHASPSVNELRLFGPGGELQPQSAWHFDAHPFPWEAGLAFDRSPVTRWDAWQEVQEGARLEVRFDKAESVSSVRVETKPDQGAVHWELQGMSAGGEWTTIQAASEEAFGQPLDLRRAAMQEFKRCNVRYILADAPPYTTAFSDYQSQWGVQKLVQYANQQLYFIE